MKILSGNRPAIIICAVFFISFILKIFITETGYNDGDSVTHYLISHFAFKHPELLLHHWGKPFFTLISAPFAFFGFGGIQFFNILCGCFSAYFSFKIAQKLNIGYAYLAIVFTLMAPIYFVVLPSGLTEPLFSFILIAAVYLLILNRNIAAALLLSFLPFVRSEGFLLIPLFGLFYLFGRSYKALPFLVTGTLAYSIIGYFAFDDLLWLFHQNPYKTSNLYGHGSLLHFTNNLKSLTGLVLTFLFATGVLHYFYITYIAHPKNALARNKLIEALIYACFIVFFVSHSVFWWKGWFGSLGMLRVVASVIPVFAIGATRGFSVISGLINLKYPKLFLTFAAAVLFVVVFTPFKFYGFAEKMDERLKVVKTACQYIKDQDIDKSTVYFSHPFTVVCLDLDPFKQNDPRELMYLPFGPSSIPSGSYILWDSQFAPAESHTPLELLTQSGNFDLVKEFKPAEDIEVFGGGKYIVYLFRRK